LDTGPLELGGWVVALRPLEVGGWDVGGRDVRPLEVGGWDVRPLEVGGWVVRLLALVLCWKVSGPMVGVDMFGGGAGDRTGSSLVVWGGGGTMRVSRGGCSNEGMIPRRCGGGEGVVKRGGGEGVVRCGGGDGGIPSLSSGGGGAAYAGAG
jgi:hypothetical protein